MTVRILRGDVRAMLKTMEPDSVDCVVTSPPYWGLRDYGTAVWAGGDANCQHEGHERYYTEKTASKAGSGDAFSQAGAENAERLRAGRWREHGRCVKCGAVHSDAQIGLERTLAEHIEVLVGVFNDVRRVMKPQATLWLNYGDCYATSVNGRSAAATKATGNDDRTFRDKPFSTVQGTLKPKDLCMVANRLAIALQDAGWWVRSEIVWGKNNPMPDSSGKYRPSTAHEKIFLLTKSAKSYYDAEAVALPCSQSTHARLAQDVQNQIGSERANGGRKTNGNMKAVSRKVAAPGSGTRNNSSMDEALAIMPETRYLRNYEPAPIGVWEMSTQPFSEAHFATFPPELVERAVKAGCPVGGLVLDPFGGAGTTGMVADRMGRDAVLIELNPEYADIAERRIKDDAPLFVTVAA